MDIYDNTNVLEEVESFFIKFESSDTTKEGAGKSNFPLVKDQKLKETDKKKKEYFSAVSDDIKERDDLNYINVVQQNDKTKKEDWEILFPDDSNKFQEDCYPWNDHAYENRSNLYISNFTQHEEEEEDAWLFEGFPINSCPSNFHTYSNISSTLIRDNAKTEDTLKKRSTPVPTDPLKKPFVCPECKRTFPDVFYLNLHMKRHKGEKDFLCAHCSYKSFSKAELKLHIQRIHTKTKDILCEYCGAWFFTIISLKEHIEMVHFRLNLIVCNLCTYKTYSPLILKKHITQSHKRKYNPLVCPVCCFETKGKQNLLNHVKSHVSNKPYRCETCGKHFALKKQLSAHMKTIHKPRQFTCEVCQKLFQSKFHLDRHLNIHYNSKPFYCPFCLYSSNTHGNLSNHVRGIHGKKDFSIKKFKSSNSPDIFNALSMEKGKDITVKFLNNLSKKMGVDITLQNLQEQRQQRVQEDLTKKEELFRECLKVIENLQPEDHTYSGKFVK
uniref:C2H2-type domain-containing protein n=1 Tax=Clastoptera arizonana TaxID=38151 RepID=A0A1B6CP34_9HEMI